VGLGDNSPGDITQVTICGVAVTNIESQSSTQVVVWTGAAVAPGLDDVRVFSTSVGELVRFNAFTYYIPPELGMLGTNGAAIASGEAASADQGTDFGSLSWGSVLTNTFVVTNNGGIALTVTGITINGAGAAQFSVLEYPATVAAGATGNLRVRYNPLSGGAHTASVQIANDTALNPFVLNLAGAGLKHDQAITFPAIPAQTTTNTVVLSATAASGLPVSFTVASGPGAINTGVLRFTATGMVSVVASQAGNTNWNAAVPVTNLVVVTAPSAPLTVLPNAPQGVSALWIHLNASPGDGASADKVQLTWNTVANATGYQVWRHTANVPAQASLLGVAASAAYEDTRVTGSLYYYWVKATNASGASAFSSAAIGQWNPADQAPSAPTGLSASDGAYTDKVRVTWTAASGATSYQVWRHTANNSAAASQIGTTTSATYNDLGAVAGTTYYYWVNAINTAGTSGFSASDSGFRALSVTILAAPTGISASDGTYTNKVQVTWNAVSGATGYRIWRSASANIASGSNLVEMAITGTTYDDLTAAKTPGALLYYWVQAVSNTSASGFSTNDSGYVKPASGPTIKANGAVGDVAISYPDAMAITIEVNEDNNAGAPVEWWILALAGSSWYYLNSALEWTPFDGNPANCQPAYQGAAGNLPATLLPELKVPGLPVSAYTFWFAVDSQVDGMVNEDAHTLVDSVNVTLLSMAPAPRVKANGAAGAITVNASDPVAITVEMDARAYAGVPVDWWVLLCAGSAWYYLDSSGQWTSFDGNPANCAPVYQGALGDLPATPVLTGALVSGTYNFYFAVDYPMDGVLNFEQMWFAAVQLSVP
jgi:fibronectin type 3 domain-containing protein